jgi:peroxiredoxin Q/BCP
LARLKDDYPEFVSRGAEVIAVGPDGAGAFGLYWRAERLPFVGLPDPDHRVARRFKQEVNLFKLGRMPFVVVIDGAGMVRFAHHGASMADIPTNSTLFEVIERIVASAAQA